MPNTEGKVIYMDEETKYLLDFIRQWEEKHPDEEMVFITLPKYDLEERKRILETAIEIMGNVGEGDPPSGRM